MLATFGYGTGRIATHGYSPAVEAPAPERVRVIISLFESKIFSPLPGIVDTTYYSSPGAYNIASNKDKEDMAVPLGNSKASKATEIDTIISYSIAPNNIMFVRGSAVKADTGVPRGPVQTKYLNTTGVQSNMIERRGAITPQYLKPSRSLE